jgi:5'-nucleotidase
MDAIDAEKKKREQLGRASPGAALWKRAAELVHQHRSKVHYRGHFKITSLEHMSCVDAFDGESARKGREAGPTSVEDNPDLLVVTPEVDGRLKDEGRVSGKQN